jgi:hypothetical protein
VSSKPPAAAGLPAVSAPERQRGERRGCHFSSQDSGACGACGALARGAIVWGGAAATPGGSEQISACRRLQSTPVRRKWSYKYTQHRVGSNSIRLITHCKRVIWISLCWAKNNNSLGHEGRRAACGAINYSPRN